MNRIQYRKTINIADRLLHFHVPYSKWGDRWDRHASRYNMAGTRRVNVLRMGRTGEEKSRYDSILRYLWAKTTPVLTRKHRRYCRRTKAAASKNSHQQ